MSEYGRNGANDGKDFLGRELKVGQRVAKATAFGRSACIEVKEVSRVEGINVYLNGWHQPVMYTGRLVILD